MEPAELARLRQSVRELEDDPWERGTKPLQKRETTED